MKNNIIEVKNLKRSFRISKKDQFTALKGINFSVKEGEIFGLLGPNGAGKTTTIKILTTMLAPSSGSVKVLGFDTFNEAKEVREHINFVFGGERSLYWRLSARDNLAYFADLYKIPRKNQNELIENLIKHVGLSEFIDKKVETFSKGMKQRLQVARSLLNNPKIIFLDEPSIGLDPVGAKELRKLIKELAKDGVTILLTTHYMPEAEELCDRIAIIRKGEIIALDNVVGLQNLVSIGRKEEIKAKKVREQEERNKQNLEITLEDIYIELLEEK
ncbi:ABC transporter ATP-binding protein [Gemella cuniculi]|uniref:ABC transporter ATP-binding protein n=1 Tax=Gemella cuniculi TaxID=150240 RepID=UPI000428EAC9|nr:ABC transporter ATP-binding protein [Gemella cuniculi]